MAQNSHGYAAYDATTRAWQPYTQAVPFGGQPKLYEDARYLAYAECRGEWGGVVYFYNKQTRQTHQLTATCANSVWQQDGHYRVLSSLAHLMGSADCVALTDPELLPLAATVRKNNFLLGAPAPPPGVAHRYSTTTTCCCSAASAAKPDVLPSCPGAALPSW